MPLFKYLFLLFFGWVFLINSGFSQDLVFLENPSFEGQISRDQLPWSWHNCGFPGEGLPDTHPGKVIGVSKPAIHGHSYLGLLVHENNTWEAVSTQLFNPMQGVNITSFLSTLQNQKYTFLSIKN